MQVRLSTWRAKPARPWVQDAASAIIDDTFNKCFSDRNEVPWNWNFYLFPLWCGGVALRYLAWPLPLLTVCS
jgi:hypothetical protein